MLFFCLVLLLTVINKKCECEEKHGSSALSLLAPNIHVFNYELLVEPFIPFPSFTEQENQSDLTFDASVGIHFLVTDNLAILTLDSKDPQIHRFKLIDLTLNSKHIESQFEIEAENELLHVLANFLVGHEYKIEIDYSASLNDKAVGFFYNTYFGFNQTNKGLLATVLSPKTAHTMFPCIDNPNYKATFDLTVIYPKGASIFHNTLETWTREYNEHKMIAKFEQTPLMSVYLFSLVIGEFDTIKMYSKSGVLVRASASPENSDYLNESLKVTTACIDVYEQYLNLDFPIKKLDIIDIRKTSRGAAIENIGSVLYAGYISYNPNAINAVAKQTLKLMFCHEVVHHWFGDLVTLKQWNNTFLHEGLATFLEYRGLELISPENAEQTELDLCGERDYGMRIMDLNNHTVLNNNGLFGSTVYVASASIMKMLESVVGPEVMRLALTLFVEKHKYSNVNEHDLVRAIETVNGNQNLCSNLTINDFILDYLLQSHYPIVSVSIKDNEFVLTQQASNHSLNYRWNIPLFVLDLTTNETHLYWLLKNGELCSSGDTPSLNIRHKYIFNYKAKAYIRIDYSPKVLNELMDEDLSILDDQTALGMVQDANAIDGRAIGELLLKFMNDLNGTASNYMVHYTIQAFYKIFTAILNTHEYDLFVQLHTRQLENLYKYIKWEPTEKLEISMMNEILVSYAVYFEIGDAREQAIKLFEEFRANCSHALVPLDKCNLIPSDFRESSYVAAVLNPKHEVFLVGYYIAIWSQRSIHSHFIFEMKKVVKSFEYINDLDRIVFWIRITGQRNRKEFMELMKNEIGNIPSIYQPFLLFMDRPRCHELMQKDFINFLIELISGTWHSVDRLKKLDEVRIQLERYVDLEVRPFLDDSMEIMRNLTIVNLDNIRKSVRKVYDLALPVINSTWETKPLELNIKNITYALTVEPHFSVKEFQVDESKAMSLDGHVNIEFTTTAPTTTISLHSHRHVINSINATINSSSPIELEFKREYEKTLLHITFKQEINANTRVQLSISYIGFISMLSDDKQYGLVILKYYNSFTETMDQMFTTQLSEGLNPRTLLPCFDSPNHKAVWKLKVRHFRSLTVLSNEKIESVVSISSEKLETTFKATTPMASFLFAVELGEIQSINGITSSGIPVNVYTANNYQNYGQMALESAILALEYLDKTLELPYHKFSSKLDVLAFKKFYGAMENTQMVVLNEHHVLYDKDSQTLDYKRDLFAQIGHEIAHQWFGDLISTRYWNQLFLSESLARFFGIELCEQFDRKEIHMFENSEIGMRYEEQNPIPVVYEKFNKLTNPFKTTIFNKVATVLHTLRYLIGNQTFMNAINLYVRENSFGIVEDLDLYRAFDQAIEPLKFLNWNNELLKAKDYFDSFVKQASFPVIHVKLEEQSNMVEIWQKAYHNTSSLSISEYNYQWRFPLFLMNTNKTIAQIGWLKESAQLKVNQSTFLLVNPKRLVYARVLYDNSTWEIVLKHFDQLDEITKASILTDTYSFIKQGTLKWSRLFDLFEHLQTESSELVWKYATEIFMELLRRFKPHKEELQKLKTMIEKLLNKRGEIEYNRINKWEKNDVNTYFVRLHSQLKTVDFVKKTAPLSIRLYNRCLGSLYGIDECFLILPEHRSAVLCSAVQEYPTVIEPRLIDLLPHYGELSVDELFLRYQVIPFVEAVGCIDDSAKLKVYINATLCGEFEPFADLILESICQRDETQSQLYNYFIEYFNEVTLTYEFDLFVKSMTFDWSTEWQLNQLQLFNQPKLLSKKQQKTMNEAIERINKNIKWSNENFVDISEWLKSHY